MSKSLSILVCLESCQTVEELVDVTNEEKNLIITLNSPKENYTKFARSSNENFNADIEQEDETFTDCCVFT